MPKYSARHYDIEVQPLNEAAKHLDAKYQLGWRVVKMTLHPDGNRVIFLLEKIDPSQK
jgi:hypothetical protein